jgi:hypothetical protein
MELAATTGEFGADGRWPLGEKLGEIFPPNYFQECMCFLIVL